MLIGFRRFMVSHLQNRYQFITRGNTEEVAGLLTPQTPVARKFYACAAIGRNCPTMGCDVTLHNATAALATDERTASRTMRALTV